MINNKSIVEILQLKLIVSLIMSLRSFESFLVRSAINSRSANLITQQQQLNFVKIIANNQFYQSIKHKSTYKSKSPRDKSSRSSSKSPSKSKSTSMNPSKSEPSKRYFDSKSWKSMEKTLWMKSSQNIKSKKLFSVKPQFHCNKV